MAQSFAMVDKFGLITDFKPNLSCIGPYTDLKFTSKGVLTLINEPKYILLPRENTV